MIIKTSFPGQSEQFILAPEHIERQIRQGLLPFIEIVSKGNSVGDYTDFEEVPAAWVNPDVSATHRTCGAHHEGWVPAYCKKTKKET